MPSIPKLTLDERLDAIELARARRQERAEMYAKLKSGDVKFVDVLESDSEIARRMFVIRALRSLPKVGVRKADRVMEIVGISPRRRIQGLGPRQRRELVELLDDMGVAIR